MLWLINISAFSQSRDVDSLSNLIHITDDANEKAKLLFLRSKLYAQNDTEKTLADASEALSLFEKTNNIHGQIDALLQIANVYSRQNNYQKALETSETSLLLARKYQYIFGEAIALSNIARNQVQMGMMDNAEKLYLESLDLMIKSGNEKDAADIWNRLGIMYFKSGKYQRAMDCLDSGIFIAQKYNMNSLLAYLYMNKANNLTELTRYDEALEFHLKSAELKEESGDEKGLLQSYNNIGNLYNKLDRAENAVQYYRRSIILADKARLKSSLALGYSNLAIALAKLHQTDSVGYYYELAITSFEQTGEKTGLARTLHNYGNFLLNQNEYQKSEKTLTKALEIRQEINAPFDLASTLHLLGKIQTIKKNYARAEQLLNDALRLIAPENGLREAEILQSLADFYKTTGNYKDALFYKDRNAVLKDSILQESELLKIQQLQSEYEIAKKQVELNLEKKEKELKNQTIKKKQNQMLYLFAVLFLLMAVVVLFIIAYRNKTKYANELLQRKVQVETLLQEIHHRVKNNLQIVSGLLSLHSRQTEDELSRQIIDEGRTRLEAIGLIHQRLYNSNSFTKIEIRDYIENLSSLIADSFGHSTHKITTIVNLPNTYLDVDYAIPVGLIINELLTNAFKHAVPSESTHLNIRIKLTDKGNNKIELVVEDNGSLPEKVNDNSENPSFGLTLIHILAKQLGGNVKKTFLNGTIFTINFVIE